MAEHLSGLVRLPHHAPTGAYRGGRAGDRLWCGGADRLKRGNAASAERAASEWTRRVNAGALVVAITLALYEISLGIRAFGSPHGVIGGVPYFMLFSLATVTTMAAAGDIRMIRWGRLRAGPRIARHLWRMCFALFIAAGSFFSIRERVAKILPAALTTPALRALPVVLIFVAMFYWLWRVRAGRPPHVRRVSTSTR